MIEVKYRISTFPSSEKFRVFRVINTHIWQVLNPKAYNMDTGEIEYFDFQFDDPITAGIICDYLNEAENDING